MRSPTADELQDIQPTAQSFNQWITAFLDVLAEIFKDSPDDAKSIVTLKSALHAVTLVKPTTAFVNYAKHIEPYIDQILNKDESFIVNDAQKIKYIGHLPIARYWPTLSDTLQGYIWYYLTKMAEMSRDLINYLHPSESAVATPGTQALSQEQAVEMYQNFCAGAPDPQGPQVAAALPYLSAIPREQLEAIMNGQMPDVDSMMSTMSSAMGAMGGGSGGPTSPTDMISTLMQTMGPLMSGLNSPLDEGLSVEERRKRVYELVDTFTSSESPFMQMIPATAGDGMDAMQIHTLASTTINNMLSEHILPEDDPLLKLIRRAQDYILSVCATVMRGEMYFPTKRDEFIYIMKEFLVKFLSEEDLNNVMFIVASNPLAAQMMSKMGVPIGGMLNNPFQSSVASGSSGGASKMSKMSKVPNKVKRD